MAFYDIQLRPKPISTMKRTLFARCSFGDGSGTICTVVNQLAMPIPQWCGYNFDEDSLAWMNEWMNEVYGRLFVVCLLSGSEV